MRRLTLALPFLILLAPAAVAADVEAVDWGTVDGKPVKLYTLTNSNGLVMKVTDYGAIITELHVPDRDGNLADIVLGFDDLDGYLAGHPYFGAVAGRCANRIANGKFELDGKSYELATNDGPNHLHGGIKGFDKYIWSAETIDTDEGPGIRLTRTSPDGEEGYPGEVEATVTYVLTNQDELKITMEATTDAPTVVNLAQHTYWNLGGHDSGEIVDQVAQLHASRYTPVDETLIPTGEQAEVAGTPFDFTTPKPIGRDLKAAGGTPIGYDHNFVVDGDPVTLRPVAVVHDPKSGRQLELLADKPGVQFYTGNFLDGTNVGKGGAVYRQYNGFCLETQNFPDSIHQPEWPSVVLRPGEGYRHRMVVKFGTR